MSLLHLHQDSYALAQSLWAALLSTRKTPRMNAQPLANPAQTLLMESSAAEMLVHETTVLPGRLLPDIESSAMITSLF